jgi:NIMA (never in mitosis gene a)-related kinase
MQKLKQQDEFAHYKKIKLLGEGSFGKAYLIERISDKLLCVMKTIDITRMGEAEKRDTL